MLGGLFGSSSNSESQKENTRTAAQVARTESMIGKGADFTGTITAEGSVRIAGSVTGDVTAGENLIILDGGSLEGDVLCDTAVIAGTLNGDITARRVAVRATGRVLGDLRLERLASDEGSFVKGLVTMEESIDIKGLIAKTTGKPVEKEESTDEADDENTGEEQPGEDEPEESEKPASKKKGKCHKIAA